jgi:hypothetical protein
MNSGSKVAVAVLLLACACDVAMVGNGTGGSSGGGRSSSGGSSSSGASTSSSSSSSSGASTSSSSSSSSGASSSSSSSSSSGASTSSSSSSSSGASSSSSSSSGATSSSSSSSGGPSSSGASGAGCTGAALCDDFESATPGGTPGASWEIWRGGQNGPGGAVVVDGAQAHSGTRSIRVDGGSGYNNRIFMRNTAIAGLGSVVYARFWMRVSTPFDQSHVTFLAMRDESEGKDVRMGGQAEILMYNRESDDATLPELSPTGIGLSVKLQTNRWICVEFKIDQGAGGIDTWVDGTEVKGLIVDGTPTQDVDGQWLRKTWRPSLKDFRLGWESYGGGTMTLWYDDVALSTRRIGCGP